MVAPSTTPPSRWVAATTACPKCHMKLRVERGTLKPEPCPVCGSIKVVEAAKAIRADRAGLSNEVALATALVDAGLVGFEVQYPWGMLLSPARRFQADIGYPKHRVIVESIGGAHATKRNVNADCERSALAASIGILVVPCHPGMIRDGSAVELVRRALATTGRGAESFVRPCRQASGGSES